MNEGAEKKLEMIEAERALMEAGLISRGGVGISGRIDADTFYYAGGDSRFGELRPEDIRRVRVRGTTEGEAGIHACIYRAREDIGAVIFTRQMRASSLGVLGRETLAAENGDGERVRIRIAPFSIPGSDARKSHVRRLVGKADGPRFLIMANSGVYIFGEDCMQAVNAAFALEQFAASWLKEFCSTDIEPGVVVGYNSVRTRAGVEYAESGTPGRVRAIHDELYALRGDIGAVVHDVSEAAKAVSRLGGLTGLYYDDQAVLGVSDNTRFVYDDGVYCLGEDREAAGRVAEASERACLAQLAALRSGEVHVISRRDERRLRRK